MGSMQTIKGVWSGIQTGPRPIRHCAGVYKGGSRRVHSFSLWLQTTLFQGEICTIKACLIENIENGCTCKNVYSLSDNQAVIKAVDSSQITST
jgi:hypothetical protein